MAFYARVVDGIVYEVVNAPIEIGGQTYEIGEMYAPEVIAMLTPCPDTVVQNATYDGNTFTNPVAPTEPTDPPTSTSTTAP